MRAAERRVQAALARIAGDARAAGLRVEESGDRVTISGRGVLERRVFDPAVRWLGRAL